MSTRLTFMKYKQVRWYSTKYKMKVTDALNELLTNNDLKHKHHPGIMKPRQIEQPEWLVKSIRTILHDETVSPKVIHASGEKLAAHLNGRRPPHENKDVQLKLQKVKEKFRTNDTQDSSNDDLLTNRKATKFLKTLLYNWNPISYDKYTSLAYLVGRSVPEYCVLYKIFNELANNDKNFTPNSLFDFGSGIGTVMWAASQFWVKSIKEYYCVDVSGEMNNLSQYLMKTATPQINQNHIFYRQFFPASLTPTYDIVVSAYSLFELPSQKARLEVLLKLWRKTEQYMIIVEQGTRAGFKLVTEARDFILNCEEDAHNAHVFSPCPHDLKCPRFMTDDTPCNFTISYLTLPIGDNSKYKHESYSYVVLKKGTRSEEDCKWPRIVRPVLKRSGHVICRMCTASGELEEQIFTTWKNGKNTYRCARCSEWGDRLPFKIEEPEETEESE